MRSERPSEGLAESKEPSFAGAVGGLLWFTAKRAARRDETMLPPSSLIMCCAAHLDWSRSTEQGWSSVGLGASLDGRAGRISRAAIATLRELGADWLTWPLASTAWSAPARRAFARPVSAAPSGAS